MPVGETKSRLRTYPMFHLAEFKAAAEKSSEVNFVSASLSGITDENLRLLQADPTVVLVIETANLHGYAEQRRLFVDLMVKMTCRSLCGAVSGITC